MACTDYTRRRSVHSMGFLDSSVGPFHLVVECHYPFHRLFGVAVCSAHFVPTVLTFKLFNWLSNLNYFVGLNGSQNCLTVVTNMNSSYDLSDVISTNITSFSSCYLMLVRIGENVLPQSSAFLHLLRPLLVNYKCVRTYIHTDL